MTDTSGGRDATATRVLVVDDDAFVRSGLRMVLETAADLSVVGEAADGTEVVESRPCSDTVRTSWSWTSGCRG